MSEQTTPNAEGAQGGQNTPEPQSKGGFEPITIDSQEQLDGLFSRRFAKVMAKFDGYDEYKAKALKYDELEEASKSDAQKLQERAEVAEKELEKFKLREQISEWAAEASKDTGVPAELLRGSTKEELMSHAESLAPHFKEDATPYIGNEGGQQGKNIAASDEQVFASFMDKNFK